MLLNSNTAVSYPKFRKHGDSVTGIFLDYKEDVPSRFGTENLLMLQNDQAKLIIRTPTNLSRTLRQNLQALPGKRLTITYMGDAPSKKGKPVKLFTVDADEVATAGATSAVPTAAANFPMHSAEAPPSTKVG